MEQKPIVKASQDIKQEDPYKIHKYVDHTVLKAETTWSDIKKVCDEAMEYNFAAICIPACYVKAAREYLDKQKPQT